MNPTNDESELERLLARCRAGDERAWRQIVERFKSLVFGTARHAGLGTDDAEDVFLSTFVALYRSLDRITSPRAVRGWLVTTTAREAVRIRRLQQARPTTELGTLEEIIAADEASALDVAGDAELGETVREAMGKIGKMCQELLTMLYIGEPASYQTITESLGMPMGSIGPTRARCLGKLREVLRSRDFFSTDVHQIGECDTLEGHTR